jgi:hypothetical protein
MNSKGYGSEKEIKKIAEHVWEEMIGFSKIRTMVIIK